MRMLGPGTPHCSEGLSPASRVSDVHVDGYAVEAVRGVRASRGGGTVRTMETTRARGARFAALSTAVRQ